MKILFFAGIITVFVIGIKGGGESVVGIGSAEKTTNSSSKVDGGVDVSSEKTTAAFSSGELSTSTMPNPPPPATHPNSGESPSEQKVSSQSAEKEKPEENNNKAPSTNAKDMSSGTGGSGTGTTSAEVGHSSSEQPPNGAGRSSQLLGWLTSSVLVLLAWATTF
uniref:Candidate secreted effector n=1 Tax=Meloidogyne incognita TaxID=6306 RepID=A0A914KVP2_MELIC